MMKRMLFNTGWVFHEGFDPAWVTLPLPGATVRLPHNAVNLPWNYGDERSYQRPFTYQRVLAWDDRFRGQEVVLHFEAAMANAKVWVNGTHVVHHADGYTPFEARLTDHLDGTDALITVCIDGTENSDIPPFGGRIDYLTYAGIYRDVWLDVRPAISIENVKLEVINPMAATATARVKVWLSNPQSSPITGTLLLDLLDGFGDPIGDAQTIPLNGEIGEAEVTLGHNLTRWSIDNPALHRFRVTYQDGPQEATFDITTGIRKAEFRSDGFFLNDEPVQIIGLNRHQSFAHVGYALGPEAQAQDADLLKFELGLNLVRTSHYPQSKAFLERCDEIGLLVFEEIPGWQHIGGEAFKAQTLKNVESMIRRDWNHPSIIIWGVRINESQDDDALYTQTNALSRQLDPTRQTGGVRYITDSNLLEDVYTMNDFVLGEEHLPPDMQTRRIPGHNGRPRTPLRDPSEVTGLPHPVPYIVTEYNGHMYPTKLFDGEERQEEHVLRHLEVLDAAHGNPGISGSIGWCMADYNTHADFGSGDRICYHGVMSMSRARKFAACAYASQGIEPSRRPILEPVTHWSFGDRKVGGIFPLIVLTNCDRIAFQYGDDAPMMFEPARDRFPHLPHPPVIIEPTDLPAETRIVWGQSWRDGVITGFVGSEPVIERRYVEDPLPTTLDIEVPPVIRKNDTYWDRPVRITARDQVGNRLPYLMDQLYLTVESPALLQGPATIPMIGGVAAAWVRATDTAPVALTVTPLSGSFAPIIATLDA
ncbi:MAG: glycoside hydrolase family 2 TIM barrel-domain containing protein [Pseudomonadota bacterium]